MKGLLLRALFAAMLVFSLGSSVNAAEIVRIEIIGVVRTNGMVHTIFRYHYSDGTSSVESRPAVDV